MKKYVLPLALLASLSAYGHDVFVYNGLNPKPVQTATGLRSIVFGDDATVAVADMDHFTFYRRADIPVEAERIRHIYADQQGE